MVFSVGYTRAMPPLTTELKWSFGVSRAGADGGGVPAGPSGRELAGLGLALAASVLLPLFVGIAADALLRTSPIGLVVGLALGIVVATVVVFQRFKRYMT